MPYLLRAKGTALVMRDPADGIAYEVPVKDFVQFGELPPGTAAVGDADVEVKEVVGKSSGKKPKPFVLGKKEEPKAKEPEIEDPPADE